MHALDQIHRHTPSTPPPASTPHLCRTQQSRFLLHFLLVRFALSYEVCVEYGIRARAAAGTGVGWTPQRTLLVHLPEWQSLVFNTPFYIQLFTNYLSVLYATEIVRMPSDHDAMPVRAAIRPSVFFETVMEPRSPTRKLTAETSSTSSDCQGKHFMADD